MAQDIRDLDDATLARRVAATREHPDSAAETELYRRLAPRVRLYGLRHLRDPQAAHDLMQQVLLMTLERLRAGELREPGRIASYVLGMSRRVVLELRRGGWRREALLETHADALQIDTTNEPEALDTNRLAACLQALSERERTIIALSFFAERSADDTASQLGLSAGNVRVIRHRALVRLRKCMDGAQP